MGARTRGVGPRVLSPRRPRPRGAQMMPAGAKTGGTQSDSTISQPQDKGVQALSWSSSAGSGFPWQSWTASLQARHSRGARGAPTHEMPQGGQGKGILGAFASPAPYAEMELSCPRLLQ